jgi:acetyl/propionyl-CoA carboxylase alpha subunit
VRVESGIYEGFEVSLYYDSMISKLIVWGETRGEALLRMRRALEEYCIIGIKTNIPFHQQMMDSTRFIGGQFDTTFVENRFAMSEPQREAQRETAAVAAALWIHSKGWPAASPQQPEPSPWKQVGRWRAMRHEV